MRLRHFPWKEGGRAGRAAGGEGVEAQRIFAWDRAYVDTPLECFDYAEFASTIVRNKWNSPCT